MEIQEAFNKAWNGIKDQPRLSYITNVGCTYDDGEGCRCTVGHCLNTTTIRRIRFAGKIASPLAELIALGLVPRTFDRKFFYDLQRAHDIANSVKHCLTHLRALALTYELEIPA